MTREEEFEKVKEAINGNIEWGWGGLFFVPNIVGDSVETIFNGNYFKVNHCSGYCYFDVFGCSEEEKKALDQYYQNLIEKYKKAWENS